MANPLGRDIEKGEIVVLKEELFMPQYQDVESRTVEVLDGFGMSVVTSGHALSVKFLCDGEEARFDSFDISVEETKKAQGSKKVKMNKKKVWLEYDDSAEFVSFEREGSGFNLNGALHRAFDAGYDSRNAEVERLRELLRRALPYCEWDTLNDPLRESIEAELEKE